MGASESGARLTQLLTDDPRYRAVWERYSVRMGGSRRCERSGSMPCARRLPLGYG
jgi:hypothetical protein